MNQEDLKELEELSNALHPTLQMSWNLVHKVFCPFWSLTALLKR